MAIGRPAITPPNPSLNWSGAQRSSAAVMASRSFFDGRLLDVIQIRKVLLHVSVPFALNAALLRAPTRRSALAVTAKQRVHDVHPRSDLTERRKSLTVESGIVGEIDEHLAGAGVGAGSCKRDVSAFVALLDWIILDGRGAPLGC